MLKGAPLSRERDDRVFPVSHLEHDVATARAEQRLTGLEAGIVDLENAGVWRYAGAKESAMLDRLGITATRYYQVLNSLIDDPVAVAAHPMLTARLRRLRDRRRRERSPRSAR